MRNIIVGTAGHIDHGKTALIRALTGTDTDRLAEEKRRGISIELGFAHLNISDKLRIGFVDVPGHERFVKNMLAGAGGIDLVLFVVAADESIKPQTREHFDICRLLGVSHGLVVLTKADLVDLEILDLERLEVEEFVRGSFLEAAPVIAASAETLEGIDELREQLARLASTVSTKDSSRHFRLPVDRTFSMKGFGAVVTGTLVSGAVSVEDEVEAHPSGARLRVRGIQVHDAETRKALAGQRTALNLAGPAASSVNRGATLTPPGIFQPTRSIDCLLELLSSAKPLKHRAPVRFHTGTAEVVAETRLLESNEALRPGSAAFVRFLLREPVLVLPGDRFIVRMFSPVTTIGGGLVLDVAPPPRMRRADAVARLKTLASDSQEERVALLVSESRYGSAVDEIVGRTGLLAREIHEATADRLLYWTQPRPWLLDRAGFESFQSDARQALATFHRGNPLKPGMPKEELRAAVVPDSPPFLLDAIVSAAGDLVAEGEIIRLASHRVSLKQDEEEALRKIESAFRQAGLAVPATSAALGKSGVEASRAGALLRILIRQGRLVKVSDELVYHSSAVDSLKQLLASHKGERFKVPQFKEWTGISRKYAIPLLEFLDRAHVTRREGDDRVVL